MTCSTPPRIGDVGDIHWWRGKNAILEPTTVNINEVTDVGRQYGGDPNGYRRSMFPGISTNKPHLGQNSNLYYWDGTHAKYVSMSGTQFLETTTAIVDMPATLGWAYDIYTIVARGSTAGSGTDPWAWLSFAVDGAYQQMDLSHDFGANKTHCWNNQGSWYTPLDGTPIPDTGATNCWKIVTYHCKPGASGLNDFRMYIGKTLIASGNAVSTAQAMNKARIGAHSNANPPAAAGAHYVADCFVCFNSSAHTTTTREYLVDWFVNEYGCDSQLMTP